MYVYLDILVLINLAVNGLVLWLTAWLLGVSYQWYKMGTALLLTVIYVIMFAAQPDSIWSSSLTKLIISAVVIFIAFGKKNWREFFLLLGSFYLISFILGGAVLGYYFFCNKIVSLADVHSFTLSLPLLLTGIFVGALLFYLMGKFIFLRKANAYLLREIRLSNQYGELLLRGFWDSGNQLYDLTGSRPVLLVEWKALQPLFSKETNHFLRKTPAEEWFSCWPKCADEEWKTSVAMISYRSIGHTNVLIGQRFAHVQLQRGSGWHDIDCVVGIYPGNLSGDGSYQALLHGSMC